VPEVLYDILRAAYKHRGFSFVRVLQRCPEFMPKAFDPWLHDPQRTMLLTPCRRAAAEPEPASAYRNQREHDPSNIDQAREIASMDEPIPVGILYRNPDRRLLRGPAPCRRLRSPETIRAGLNRELDKSPCGPTTRCPAQARRVTAAIHSVESQRWTCPPSTPDQLIFHLTGGARARA
jgi:2-oxoglutarate ferredoxin oxidoreductase subunit beta